jgi:hypothetical protein
MMPALDAIPQIDFAVVIITTQIIAARIITTKTITTKIIITTKIVGERPKVMEIDVTDTIEEAVSVPGCRTRQEIQLRA